MGLRGLGVCVPGLLCSRVGVIRPCVGSGYVGSGLSVDSLSNDRTGTLLL